MRGTISYGIEQDEMLYMPNVVNVRAMGAVGNGIINDARAIQKAFDFLKDTGGTILFPVGTYLITSQVFFYSNQKIVFEKGAKLLQGNAMDNLMMNYSTSTTGAYDATENVEIVGGIFDGGSYTTNNTLLGVCHAKNIKITDCTFVNAYGSWHNLEINACKNVVIDSCRFDGSRKTSSNGCLIQIDNFTSTATWPWGNGLVDNTVCYLVEIRGCHFYNSSQAPAIGNHSPAISNAIRIHGNTFENITASRGAINFVNATNVDVHDNTFIDCTTGVVVGTADGTNLVHNNRFVGVTSVTNNSCNADSNMVNGELVTDDNYVMADDLKALAYKDVISESDLDAALIEKVNRIGDESHDDCVKADDLKALAYKDVITETDLHESLLERLNNLGNGSSGDGSSCNCPTGTVNAPTTISWDTSVTPTVTFDLPGFGYTAHKISEATPTKDTLLSASYSLSNYNGSIVYDVTLPETDIVIETDDLIIIQWSSSPYYGYVIAYTSGEVSISYSGTKISLTVPESGFYQIWDTDSTLPATMFGSMSYTVEQEVNFVQADWNQNDSTKPDFVKNRPFGPLPPETIFNRVLQDVYNESNSAWSGEITVEDTSNVDLIPGNTYTYTWNGETYNSECFALSGLNCIGNGVSVGLTDNQQPVIIARDSGGTMSGGTPAWQIIILAVMGAPYGTISEDGKYSCEIIGSSLKKLDSKFIGDIPWNKITNNPFPEVTTSDNGKIMTVVNGIWTAQTNWHPTELPSVSNSDNGKVLSVVDGTWTKTDAPSSMPTVTSVDAGKFLRVSADGLWVAETITNAEEASF